MNGDGNTVEQVNHYYPFGGLMPMGTGACTQPLKFNGKELERTNGLDLADYGARWYNPAAPAWLTIDPLAEKDYSVSPYAFCRNNPVRLVDPNGMKWVDSKDAERLTTTIEARISNLENLNSKYQTKIESGDLSAKKMERLQNGIAENNEKISHLRKSLSDINLLGEDNENTYAFRRTNGGEHHVVLEEGTVFIETSSDALSIHEITHVRQSLDAGGLEFHDGYLKNAGTAPRKMAGNEIEAYQMQHSFDDSFPGNVPSVNAINIQSVGNIKNSSGGLVYPWIRIIYENERKQLRNNKKLGL